MGKLRHALIPWEKISTQDQREAAAMGMLVPKPSRLSQLPPKLGAPWILLVTSVPSDALSVGLLGRLHPEPQVQALPGAARKQ